MSEEKAKDRYVMMFGPEYIGNRTIIAGLYGEFTFSREAEKILKEDKGHKVSKELADSIATPELCTEFRDYVKTNPDFKVKEMGFNTFLVDTPKRKRKTTQLLAAKLLDPNELAKIADDENRLERIIDTEESKKMSYYLYDSNNND